MLGLKLRSLFRRRQVEQELDEEIRYHVERQIEDLIAKGLTPRDARYEALRAIGGIEQTKEECRDMRRVQFIEQAIQDARYGVRTLLRTPGFTVIAVLTLALGIGATAAIFSVVEAALLRPLPFPDPDRLVMIQSANAATGTVVGASGADFIDWSAQSRSLELTAYSGTGFVVRDNGEPENVRGARVTQSFFDVLKVQPIIGRTFNRDETSLNGPRAIMLSHRFWQRRFGSDPGIVGKPLSTGETVIGIMPPDFKFPAYADAWVPVPSNGQEMARRSTRYWNVLGRLGQGQTVETAAAEMKTVTGRLATAYPKDNTNWGVQLSSLGGWLVRDFRTPLLVLMAAVSFLLLIACANVSGLIMARTSARRREIQVRLALGAGRLRLVRQFLVEGILLSAIGVAAGLAIARWGADALFGLLPSGNGLSSVQSDVQINPTVLAFAILVSTASSTLFALISIAATKTRPPQKRVAYRFHKGLVVAQFACAVVLVTGAGLLIQSFARMLQVDPGYDPRGLALMYLPQPAQNRAAFNARVLDEIKAMPGIESAAFMSYASFGGLNVPFNIEGQPLSEGDVVIRYSSVSADYFRTLKTQLISGREFTEEDSPNAPGVAIINETLARRYFRGENAIGKKIAISPLNQRVVREVVGIVRDIRQEAPNEALMPEVYVHWPQLPWLAPVLLIRGADAAGAIKTAQRVVSSIDKNLPPMAPRPVEELLSGQVAEPRLYTILLGIFAAVALILAMLGNYGLLSYIVNRRMHDMAVRMAIGARSSQVMRLVTAEGLRLAVLGAAIGLVAALGLTRLMKNLLFGVTPTDPVTLLSSIALMLALAVVACYIPARRATGADPVTALRHE